MRVETFPAKARGDSSSLGRIRPVILSGGSGTRLWPMSRSLHPKQLLALAQAETMLQATACRASGPDFQEPIVVAGEEHRFMIKDQLEACGMPAEAILLEPQGRNTAAAIAIAARWIIASGCDDIMLVMPSDHLVNDVDAFHRAIAAALPAVHAGALATFGITPDRPETGYGYIEAGEPHPLAAEAFAVARFVEKPDRTCAEALIAQGNVYWNGGIFLFRASAFLAELAVHAPEVAMAAESAMAASAPDGSFVRPDPAAFLACPSISVDYAVMEHTRLACVVPAAMGWSDVGSWDALWGVSPKDENGNVVHGDVIAIDSSGSLLRTDTAQTIAAVGVENVAVIATRDAILVMPRDRAQDAKRVVEALDAAGRDTHLVPAQVHRPWGTYETTDSGHRFKTKRIVVKPGQKLSLQKHHHRSEHWIIVSGTARVTVGEEVFLLQENQSTYIPAGTVHRLENPGRIPLHLIEVQCGPYLGEDDIVRLDDNYGRLD
jgi:mannose-1-phosphate guanylyltransferase/mannose-6-phosphate isomerase